MKFSKDIFALATSRILGFSADQVIELAIVGYVLQKQVSQQTLLFLPFYIGLQCGFFLL